MTGFTTHMRHPRGTCVLLVLLACGGLTGVCRTVVAAPAPPPPQARRVVLLYDERTDLPGLAALDANLVQALTSAPVDRPEVFREAMDLSRFGSDVYLQMLRDHLRAKYAEKKIDVVVAVMGPALDFVLGPGAQVFPGAAVVFCGIDRRELERRALPGHVTGVLLKREFLPTLQVALRLHPDATRVLFIGGTSEFDTRLIDQAKQEFRDYEDRLAFTYLTTIPVQALIDRVSNVPPQTIVLMSTVFRDGAGAAVIPHDVVERVTAAANVPVYGFVDQFLGRGIVGGQLYSLAAHGQQAAALARQVLAGKQPSELPVLDGAPGVVSFDARQLARWGIRESAVPAGSTILFSQPGSWRQYRVYVLGAALVLMLQTACIAALLIQRARRLRVEQALRDGQQQYKIATGAGAVGLWDWNFETNLVYIDPTIKAILGLDDAVLTMPAADWGARVHPDDLAAVTAHSQACMDGAVSEYHVEHRMLHKDGSVRWFLSRGSCVRRPDGAPQRMIGTKVDITARKRAEEAMRENQAVLEATNREMRDLAGRLIAAQEIERARIARDLHDDLSQQLAGLSIALSSFKRRVAAVPGGADLEGDVSVLQQRTVALADDIRHVSHDLHPSVLEHAGLVPALSTYCQEIQRRERLSVAFAATGDFSAISADTALCLYRVAQEALRNVVTHADAQRVDVLLRDTGDLAELSVVDDGKGFDISDTSKRRKGLGLVSITERVRLAGGGVSLVTELGKGTRVHVEVPTRAGESGTADDGSATLATTS